MTFQNSLEETFREQFCTLLGTINNYNDWFSRLPYGFINFGRGPAAAAYRYLCNREPPAVPNPPFNGGQCFVNYNWSGTQTTTRRSNGAVANTNFNRSGVPGRIGNVVITEELDAGFPVYRSRIPSTNASGVITYTDLGTVRRDIFFTPVWSNIVVSRADGLPDNCGNIDPVIPPPTPDYNTGNITVTYVNNVSATVNVNATFTFGSPVVNIEGNLIIPVRFTFDGVNIPITGVLNVNNPQLILNFGDSNYGPTDSPKADDYDSPTDTPIFPPDVPAPVLPPNPNDPGDETQRTIRACIVTVTTVPEDFGVVFQEDNPNIYIPNLGYVNFFCAIGQRAAWSVDLPVKNRRCLVVCPWEGGALAVEGTPRAGVEWVISPVYALEDDPVTYE